jgi:hypothetical protein
MKRMLAVVLALLNAGAFAEPPSFVITQRGAAVPLESSESDSDGIRRNAVDALLTSLGPELAAKLTARSRAESSMVIARVDYDKYLDMVEAAHVRWMVESLCHGSDAHEAR